MLSGEIVTQIAFVIYCTETSRHRPGIKGRDPGLLHQPNRLHAFGQPEIIRICPL